jgi:tRNA1(Val) A37 N6-methylase TrmN6
MSSVRSKGKRSSVQFTGAVYTPSNVAAALVALARSNLPTVPLRILEPSVGDGAILRELASGFDNCNFTAVDIDEPALLALRDDPNARLPTTSFVASDFLTYAAERIGTQEKFDLIIGNPPFIRKHNFSDDFKTSLSKLSEIARYSLHDLKNSWVSFLIASAHLVSESGAVALILPYELITVEYGQKALEEMLGRFERIDIFVSDDKAFPDIDQDAVIFFGQKRSISGLGLYINRVEQISELGNPRTQPLQLGGNNDRALELNAFLLSSDTLEMLRELRVSCTRLSEFAGSAPGIVSAANEFFILRKKDVTRLGLADHVIPILKKGSFASHKPTFTEADFAALAEREPCYLLRLSGDQSTFDEAVQNYIKKGEEKEYQLRYKCRNRENWYEVPIVAREKGFVFKRSYSLPRLCLNEADVYLTDTAYGLRMKDGYSIRGLCYSFYNSLTLLFAETNGRFYGGGVLELSPKEFRGLPLIYHEPTEEEFQSFMSVHEAASGDAEKILDFGDNWLREKLDLTPQQMGQLRSAWRSVRAHRMRHGRKVRPAET